MWQSEQLFFAFCVDVSVFKKHTNGLHLFLRINGSMITVEGLKKTFCGKDGDVAALNGVDFALNNGDIFGIIGMSGAGKSTLLRCITMLEKPDSGSIFIDGTDILSLKGDPLRKARRQMGVVFQGYHLLMQKTAAQNVAFPLEIAGVPRKEIEERTKELLHLVKIGDKASYYPAQLSGGQKQRVAIARALATRPEVLLCDEPTSALDSLTTKQVLSLLEEINKNLKTTIIIITHEIGVVRAICNKMAVIDGGVFVEQGDAKEIFANPKSEITRLLLGISEGAV